MARSMSPLTDAVRDRSGVAGLGYLVGLVDVNTAMVGLCGPRRTGPRPRISCSMSAPLVHGPTILESHLTRAGSRLVVVGVDIYDGDGLTDMDELTDPSTSARRHRTGDVRPGAGVDSSVSSTWDPLSTIGERRHLERDGELPVEPVVERIGLHVVDAAEGVVELGNSPYVHNSRGRINGGVLGMVFQGAAEAAAPGHVGSDLHIHYLVSATWSVRCAPRPSSCARSTTTWCVASLPWTPVPTTCVVAEATVTLQRA